MRFVALAIALALSTPASAEALLLYDAKTGREFLGCLNCFHFDETAVCNRFGEYGSKYAASSIWNPHGTLGNKLNAESPWNPQGRGPRLLDEAGNFYGYFNIGPSAGDSGIALIQDLADSYDRFGGNLDAVRDALCE